MGRKSNLTEEQWGEIQKKLLEDVPARQLARDYKISEAAIRKRFGTRTKEIKAVANQIVAAETAFKSLPISAQIGARTLADRLLSISDHLSGAAEQSAASSHRLAILANQQLQNVDDVDPMKSADQLHAHGALQKLANQAAETPLNLLRANKDVVEDINREAQAKSKRIDESMPTDVVEATRRYQDFIAGS